MSAQLTVATLLLALATPLVAQSGNPSGTPHDISQVDAVPLGGVIAVPIPQQQQRRMKKYDIPELVGAHQALGPQLVDGELPAPMIDYYVRGAAVEQRVSIFRSGLAVVRMSGAGGTLRKKVILPDDAVAAYAKTASPDVLATVRSNDVTPPKETRRAVLRLSRADGTRVELTFDPSGVLPKTLDDEIKPLEDLLRALAEDRTVTSSVAGYQPRVGDELVSDDRKTWRVERVIVDSDIVQLRCTSNPTVIYVDKKFLYNYFVGKSAAARE